MCEDCVKSVRNNFKNVPVYPLVCQWAQTQAGPTLNMDKSPVHKYYHRQ